MVEEMSPQPAGMLRVIPPFAWLVILLVLFLHVPVRAQDLSPLPPAVPVLVGGLQMDRDVREETLLCYHAGAAYFIKLPHPVYGDPGIIYQRVTPGSSGHVNSFELRLYNDYPGFTRHTGQLQLTLHRRVAGLPGPFEMMQVLDADTIGNTVLTVPLESEFQFIQGEEFFLGLRFQPAASQDTVAYVTAALGAYSGHSFFLLDGQVVWWGSPDGTPFGDMHFCAQVWLDTQQAFMQFPWAQLDLGRTRAGELLQTRLPVLNQGTAPLTVHSASAVGSDWSCRLTGPDSLMPPDTLFLELDWQAPQGETATFSELTILSNASNGPERHIPLKAASSLADLLVADWDEWPAGGAQYGDSSQAGGWRLYTGLGRPGPFMGHVMPGTDQAVWDLLELRELLFEQGALVKLRWSQYQRHRVGMVLHALCWRNPQTGQWEQQAVPDLTQEPWLGPEGEWVTVPWAEWQVPVSGVHELGLLYAGPDATDMWFVDDLELMVLGALPPPTLTIHLDCGSTWLSWSPVLGADIYRVERVDCTPRQTLCWTTETAWTHIKAQRLGRALYQVTAWTEEEEVVRMRHVDTPSDEEGP